MTITGIAVPVGAAIAGIGLGGVARSWAYAMAVPEDEPRRATCVHCGSKVGRYLSAAGRCRSCRSRIGPMPYAVEATLALVFGVAAWRVREPLPMLAVLWIATLGVALAVIDRAVLRLPDRLTYPAFAGGLALLTIAALVDRTPDRLIRIGLGGVGMAAFYLVLMMILPSGMGAGDLKLALGLGTVLGWFGWRSVFLGAFAGFLLAAVIGVGLIATGRVGRKSHYPHGPFMLLGAWLTIALVA